MTATPSSEVAIGAADEGRRYAHGVAVRGRPALGVRLAFSPPRVPRVPSGRGRGSDAIWPASSALDTATRATWTRVPPTGW